MKHTSFPSREEHLDQCNTIKRRQERILQVRLQSKQMSATILEKVKREAQKQCEEIENQVLSEIRNYHRKELEYSRQQYEKCISEINQRHYLQQINTNNKSSENANKKILRNRSPVKSIGNTGFDRNVNKQLSESKSTTKSLEQRATSARHLCKKLNDKRVRVSSPPKISQHVVIDSDDDNDIQKHTMLNFRKHSPEVKHLKSLQRCNEDESHPKCRKKSSCLNTNIHKPKLIQSKAVDEERLLTNDNKSDKSQIDEMYNNLVHDRIRILEQKDKILDRQTMFLPNGANLPEKTPRFSEYFARFHNSKISSTSAIPLPNTTRSEAYINEIANDMKRIERKKKLLKNELTRSNDEKQLKNSSSEEKENEKKQNSPLSTEKPTTNSSSDKNSPTSNNDDASSKKKTTRNQLCPSPIPKATHSVNESSRESDKKLKLSSKHRHCKRKLRSNKDIQITVSNDRKSIVAHVSDTVTSTQQHCTSSSSSTDFQKNVTPPVKLVVNVLPSADCKIEIKNHHSDKRYVRSTAKQNAEKVRDWRTLFKNQDKLTESSYYSPPECNRNFPVTSSEEHDKKEATSRSRFATKDVGYYVRKLLLMSPQSIDNLDVSSCDTTLVDASSRTTSIDSIVSDEISPNARHKSSHKQISPRREVENRDDDSENVTQLLLKCLRLATTEADSINLSTFKSIDSSRDNKSPGGNAIASELNDSNILYKNFIDIAIRRLLPLYQNSLDNNLDETMQSAFVDLQNASEYESEMDESKDDDDADISVSAYLQKFVSSLSAASEQPDKNRDVIEYLKQYIEQQSSVEKNDKIAEYSFDITANEPSKEESYISLPSVRELIQRGLISESCALNETPNEPKEFLDEEEFIKKMLQVDFNSKEFSQQKNDDDVGPTTSKSDDKDPNHLSESDEKYSADIRNELRRLGLNWMNTTWQRTLQASIINSTSSAEDSAGPLRYNTQFSSNYQQPSLSSNVITSHQQPTSQKSRELLNISPIAIPDLQLSIPECFRKN